MNELAALIQQYLDKSGVSPAEFCQRIGVDRTYLSKVIAGYDFQPSEDALRRIGKEIGADPDWLCLLIGRVPERFQGDVLDLLKVCYQETGSLDGAMDVLRVQQ